MGLVAIVVCGVSLILNIVGLAIPYWIYLSIDTPLGKSTAHGGLWQACASVADSSECLTIDGAGGTLKAVRAMEILGMLVIMGALVCLCLKQFVMKGHTQLLKVGGGSAILAGLLMIIGTIIFATDSDLKPEGVDLHAGFALCIVAGIFAIITGVLAFVSKTRE